MAFLATSIWGGVGPPMRSRPPEAPIDRIEPADPMDRIEPDDPIDSSDPADPSDNTDPTESALRKDRALPADNAE